MTVKRCAGAWEAYFRVEPLADGVFAAIATPGTGAWANAGIIDLGDRSVVFDTLGTPQAAEALRDAAEHLTGQRVAHVINSHAHFDHFHGNQVFADCDIIATEPTRDTIATQGAAFLAEARADAHFLDPFARRLAAETDATWRAELAIDLAEYRQLHAALPTLAIVPPNLTFEGRMMLRGPGRAVEIVAFAGGHTPGDACLLLPAAGIAFVGDLLAVRVHPMLRGGDPGILSATLDHLASSGLRVFVAGHGEIGTRTDVRSNRQYITDVRHLADELRARGMTPDAAAATLPVSPYNGWGARNAFTQNLRFLLRS